ncbi:MAG: aromatic amino acid lyase, partial [Deltaproteobacteria bacterium]|nr:aromatic amino acid lyase [Deltaproteobacteria bacterium]
SGFSGINPEIIEVLILMINNNILPQIPEKGSVGASGDLAPLSRLALANSLVPAC